MALILFVVPRPEAIQPAGWRLLAIFAGTILALMLRPLPGGAAVLLGITAIIATGTLPLGKALSGYSDSNAWLALSAFFIGRGLIKAGLARRIALYFVRRIGQSSLGLAYSIFFSTWFWPASSPRTRPAAASSFSPSRGVSPKFTNPTPARPAACWERF